MAWSWSHTPEAYDNARRNLEDLDAETLAVIQAEWAASDLNQETHTFDPERYEFALEVIRIDALASGWRPVIESIWQRAKIRATCDNGGFNAWVCPYGCHTVPFDREQ